MRNWTMAILPLALVTGCNGAAPGDGKQGDQSQATGSESGPLAHAGPIVTQSFALTGFTGVEVAGPDDVTIRQGDSFAISARGRKETLDRLEIKLDGTKLVIGRKREGFSFSSRDDDDLDIAITMPRLNLVRLTGSGSIDADTVGGDAVEAAVTGSGDLKVAKLTGKRAEIEVSGSGDIEIAGGTIGSGELSVTGSGDIDAEGLVATTLEVSVTGSGNVDAQATGKADIRILGSGDVKLGGGANCSTRQMGSGTATCN
ncbi:head GIN domain-containing protein [Sphingopyxis sp.]|uniref:head GIN domain-containing protein n=1 Tax=Sphingopyxis sp. TaxID=1908224 RepID=UPI002EDADFFC